MTINPVFEEDKRNDGEHAYDYAKLDFSKNSKVRPYFIIYMS